MPDVDTRINLIMRLTPYLPLLLALSTSSPFWQGHLTGLVGYRLAAYDELPRTGLPELFRTNDDYNEFVAALTWAKIIPDASYIWWAMRPSIEQSDHRIARRRQLHAARRRRRHRRAVPLPGARARPRPRLNAGFDRVGRAITVENKWHAQRYGIAATFVDPFARSPMTRASNGSLQVIELITDDSRDARLRGRGRAVSHRIVDEGTSADRQIDIYGKARRPAAAG